MTIWDKVLDRVLNGFFKTGSFEVKLADGTTLSYGDGTGDPVHVTLKSADLPQKLLRDVDMAFGEGYMDGQIELRDDNLEGFFEMVLTNRVANGGVGLFHNLRRLRHFKRNLILHNPVGRAQANVAHHYDLSAELYDLFLDEDRQYSCAYFEAPDATLEEAQAAKKAHIAKKLRLTPDMHVLDIGCGWGGMALTLAKDYDVNVTGVTLSQEQHDLARQRVDDAGLSNRIDIRLQDYRHVTESFDRIVSVGMFEHVGPRHYDEYFTHVERLLTPQGVALIHTIASSDPPSLTSPWITKYIFPGGHIPSLSEIAPSFERAGLMLTDLEVWRLHYAKTLKHWHDRFMAKSDKAEALYDTRFVRMWRYYLKASEMTFRHGQQVVFQMQFSRDVGTIPLTRTYLHE